MVIILTSLPGLTNLSATSEAKWAANIASAFLLFTFLSWNGRKKYMWNLNCLNCA